MLMKELERMEEELGIVDPESPTQKPGSDLVIDSGNKHRRRMLSLSNTYSKEEISEWFDKFSKPVVVEKKFDGGSSSIFFKNGRPIKALTRGDGETGEDITENVKNNVGFMWSNPITDVFKAYNNMTISDQDLIRYIELVDNTFPIVQSFIEQSNIKHYGSEKFKNAINNYADWFKSMLNRTDKKFG
jgi:DNA ligase (NAD+)